MENNWTVEDVKRLQDLYAAWREHLVTIKMLLNKIEMLAKQENK